MHKNAKFTKTLFFCRKHTSVVDGLWKTIFQSFILPWTYQVLRFVENYTYFKVSRLVK